MSMLMLACFMALPLKFLTARQRSWPKMLPAVVNYRLLCARNLLTVLVQCQATLLGAHHCFAAGLRQSCLTVSVMPGPWRLSLINPRRAMLVDASAAKRAPPAQIERRCLLQV